MDVNENYFDNAATTPVDARVLGAMLPFFSEQFGNAHSVHTWGIRARSAVETARRHVAALIHAEDPSQIVFTSGATEGNNWILRAFGEGWVSPFEHSSVREPAQALQFHVLPSVGYEISRHDPSKPQAVGSPGPESESNRPSHRLLSVMTVNNEVGTIFEPDQLRAPGDAVHTDATQAVGKIDFHVGELDFASFSAHKFYGPKGVGAIYLKDPSAITPMIQGGEHEEGLRSGTLNVPGIVGMGAAAEIALSEMAANISHAKALRNRVLDELIDCPRIEVNGGPKASPYILSLSFADVEGETLVLELDALGFAASSGAACSSRKVEPSHMLRALGVADDLARGTIRISFGRQNTLEAAENLARAIKETVVYLRKMRK